MVAEIQSEVWSIGAGAPLQAVLDRADCPSLFRQTLTGALSWQTRNRVSIDRALALSSLAPHWYAALLALGATVTLAGRQLPGDVPLEALLDRTVQGKVTALSVRLGGVCWGEAHVARTPADEPIVAAVAALETAAGAVRLARVALTGVWPRPVALAHAPALLAGVARPSPVEREVGGEAMLAAAIRHVAEAVEQEVAPQGDYLGSAEYRRAMAGVLTRRALEACLAQGGR